MGKAVFWQEWLLLVRNKALLAGVGLLMAARVYGIFYGRSFVGQQRKVLYAVDTAQANRVNQHLAHYRADTTTKAGRRDYRFAHDAYLSDWNTQKMVYYPPTAFAALSIGQKDNYPYYHNLWLLNNVYNSKLEEIRNPDKLLAGNFDLAFVIIYLVPLWVIALAYNVLSSERENRTEVLLKIYSPSLRRIIFYKLLFRFGLTAGMVLLLSSVGFVVNQVNPATHWMGMMAWVLISLLYTTFWFSLVYLVVSFRGSSAGSALTLMASWLVLLLLIPSAINYFVGIGQMDTEQVDLITTHRDGNNELWETPPQTIIALFQRATPPFNSKRFPVVDSANARFAAYIELSQRQNNAAGAKVDGQRRVAYEKTVGFNWMNPAYTALHAFNQLAGTEVNHYLGYLEAVKIYQQQRRYFVFNYLLSGKPFGEAQYRQFPEFRFGLPLPSLGEIMGMNWPLALWTALFLAIGYGKLRRA